MKNMGFLRSVLAISICGSGALLVHCGGKTDGPMTGGESNWMRRCVDDSDCGSKRCLCGVCTDACEAAADCESLPGGACVASDQAPFAAQCGSAETTASGLCMNGCEDADDCEQSQQCVSGYSVVGDAIGAAPWAVCHDGSDGSRLFVQYPEPTDTYLPDCANPLDRDYYRVFLSASGTAYMYPSPAGSVTVELACRDSEHELAPLLVTYGLCEAERSSDNTNSMLPEDALALAHYLHQNLVFVPADGRVVPYTLSSDIYQACVADPDFAAGVMSDQCEFEMSAVEDGERDAIGFSYTAEQAIATARALNSLYGIQQQEQCAGFETWAQYELDQGAEAGASECSTGADCVLWWPSVDCAPRCASAVSVTAEADLEAVVSSLTENACAAFHDAGCTVSIALCDLRAAACVEGACTWVAL